jgi:TonB family protein
LAILAAGLAQGPASQAQESDSAATLLSWEAVTILIRSDTAYGLYLWVSAQVSTTDTTADTRVYRSRYRPDVVRAWTDEAGLLLAPDRVGRSGPQTQLATAPLPDMYGGKIVAVRTRQATRWSRDVVLSFRPAWEKPLTFRVRRSQAEAFFGALAQRARDAGLTRTDDTDYPHRCGDPADFLTQTMLVSAPELKYPGPMRNQGLPGFVLLHIAIDTSGRPSLDRSRVVFSSHPEFSRAALGLLETTRYTPPVREGRVVSAEVCQPVTFSLRFSH